MNGILLIYRPGPGWLAGKPASEQPLAEHMAYLMQLYGAGTLRFIGQFLSDGGGTLLLNVPTEHEAIALAEQDPAIQRQIFTYEAHRWQIVLGEAQPAEREARTA